MNPQLIYSFISLAVVTSLVYMYRNGTIDMTKLLLHGAVVSWSGLQYLNFTFNFYPLEYTYYVDWVVSTPLLVLALVYTSTGSIGRNGVLAAATQAGVIVSGYLAVTTDLMQPFFLLSTGLLITLFIQLYEIGGYTEKPVLHGILLLTWITYPLVWIKYDGQLLMSQLELVVLPLVSKHVFALWDAIEM